MTMYTTLTDILHNIWKEVSWLQLVFNFASHGCFIHTTQRDNHGCLSIWASWSDPCQASVWSAYNGCANL